MLKNARPGAGFPGHGSGSSGWRQLVLTPQIAAAWQIGTAKLLHHDRLAVCDGGANNNSVLRSRGSTKSERVNRAPLSRPSVGAAVELQGRAQPRSDCCAAPSEQRRLHDTEGRTFLVQSRTTQSAEGAHHRRETRRACIDASSSHFSNHLRGGSRLYRSRRPSITIASRIRKSRPLDWAMFSTETPAGRGTTEG